MQSVQKSISPKDAFYTSYIAGLLLIVMIDYMCALQKMDAQALPTSVTRVNMVFANPEAFLMPETAARESPTVKYRASPRDFAGGHLLSFITLELTRQNPWQTLLNEEITPPPSHSTPSLVTISNKLLCNLGWMLSRYIVVLSK